MRSDESIIEKTEVHAQREIAAAWRAYQGVEKRGLDFGRICYGWQQKFGAQGRPKQGLRPILDDLTIPVSTAYWWIKRYKESEDLVDVEPPPSPEEASHDVISEAICKTLLDKSIPCQNVVWAPWRAKTDAEKRAFGEEPTTDRYRVTLYLSQKEAENLACG